MGCLDTSQILTRTNKKDSALQYRMPQLKVSLYFACETWKLPVNCQRFLTRIGLARGKALLGIVCPVPYFRRLGGLYAEMDGFDCTFVFS